MSRRLKVIAAVGLVVACLAGWAVFLTGQGLDEANQWVTVAGFFVSTALGVAGLVLGWLTWRQGAAPGSPVSAAGAGAVGVGRDSTGAISTNVSGPAAGGVPPGSGGASGAGSVAIGRDNGAPIRTRVTGTGGTTTP